MEYFVPETAIGLRETSMKRAASDQPAFSLHHQETWLLLACGTQPYITSVKMNWNLFSMVRFKTSKDFNWSDLSRVSTWFWLTVTRDLSFFIDCLNLDLFHTAEISSVYETAGSIRKLCLHLICSVGKGTCPRRRGVYEENRLMSMACQHFFRVGTCLVELIHLHSSSTQHKDTCICGFVSVCGMEEYIKTREELLIN